MGKEKRGKKGLSPIIATTLLIALVVIIALLIYVWAAYFVGEAIKKQGRGAEQVCSEVSLESTYEAGVLTVTNKANVPVNSIKIVSYNADGGSDVTTITDEPKLYAGKTREIDLPGSYTKIEIIPIILGEKKQEKKEYACERHKTQANII